MPNPFNAFAISPRRDPLSLRELRDSDEVHALVQIIQAAKPLCVEAQRNYAMQDIAAMAQERLSDLIHEAFGSPLMGERNPSVEEVVAMLAEQQQRRAA